MELLSVTSASFRGRCSASSRDSSVAVSIRLALLKPVAYDIGDLAFVPEDRLPLAMFGAVLLPVSLDLSIAADDQLIDLCNRPPCSGSDGPVREAYTGYRLFSRPQCGPHPPSSSSKLASSESGLCAVLIPNVDALFSYVTAT